MKGQNQVACLLTLGLLAGLFTPFGASARDTKEDAATEESGSAFVYDHESGNFIRVHRQAPSRYRLGNLKMNVGYDPRTYRLRDAWPNNVNRFLFKRPLDQ